MTLRTVAVTAADMQPGDVIPQMAGDPRPWPTVKNVHKNTFTDPQFGPSRKVQIEGEKEPRVFHEDSEYVVERDLPDEPVAQ